MSADRDQDAEATLRMPQPIPKLDESLENVDPERTLVREDWESTAIRRVAPHVQAVQSEVAEDGVNERRFGWESEGLRRLSEVLQREGL